ncbi:MAG: preprotein translocase subunit SecE [Pseudomonadales bacterium]|nr:preprotein translocase subunit SecE [Pseudomonadales bacterium]
MNTNVQQEGSSSALDVVLWILVVVIVAAGVYGNSFFANEYSVFERTLALLPMAAIAGFLAIKTQKGAAFLRLVKESRAEIRRVVWPTRQETTQTTFMVVLVVIVMALILWGLDALLNSLVSMVIG